MDRSIKGALILSALAISSQVSAIELNSGNQNHLSVGVGSYALSIANDDNSSGDINFEGINLTAGFAVNNHFQIRASYFSLEHEQISAFENTGYDLMAYGGVGLSRKGFRGYGGAGLFSEEWSNSSQTESFSSFQLGGGIGYNWGPIALDFVINLRQADEYKEEIFESGTYVSVSGNLTVSYLF
jgi:hypothetical protein